MRKLFVTGLIAGGLSLMALAPAQAEGGCGRYYYRGWDGYCHSKGWYSSRSYGDYGYGYGYRSYRPEGYYGRSWDNDWSNNDWSNHGYDEYRRGYYSSWY